MYSVQLCPAILAVINHPPGGGLAASFHAQTYHAALSFGGSRLCGNSNAVPAAGCDEILDQGQAQGKGRMRSPLVLGRDRYRRQENAPIFRAKCTFDIFRRNGFLLEIRSDRLLKPVCAKRKRGNISGQTAAR